jgi:hypothetical protein
MLPVGSQCSQGVNHSSMCHCPFQSKGIHGKVPWEQTRRPFWKDSLHPQWTISEGVLGWGSALLEMDSPLLSLMPVNVRALHLARTFPQPALSMFPQKLFGKTEHFPTVFKNS